MSRLFNLFNTPCILAISQQGIALRTAHSNQLLASHWEGTEQLSALLATHAALLNKQTVNVVLSHTFVRYLVLPWQDNIVKQSDWQAIAQHAFRQQYDATASDWRIAVSFGTHGQTILAAAIDERLYTQLATSAQQLHFTLGAMVPLLATLEQPADKDWVMLAEPQRITLCQIRDGQWQQILVDAPAAGKEFTAAEQLFERRLLSIAPTEQPRKIVSYVSPSLKAIWKDSIDSRQQLVTIASGQQHAQWLANMLAQTANKAPYHASRQSIAQLNFGVQLAKPSLLSIGLLLLACALMVALWWGFQQVQTQLTELQKNTPNLAQSRPVLALNPQDTTLAEKTNMAKQAQQQLNLPWIPMLSALEKVKQHNPTVQLMRIRPNISRAEIRLHGEAATFADITQFLTDLRAAPAFSDAVLVSQHLEQYTDKPAPTLVFELNVDWRI